MPIISVRIPQLGEGLQEALLVEFLKEPGDTVERDEPIYVMETDKAVTEVESPYAGTLVEWVAETNSVLPIGTEVARMEVAEGVKEMPAGHKPAELSTAAEAVAAATAPNRPTIPIPPRTRKYLKDKGLLDVADEIPAAGAKLMVEDVDRYLAEQGGGASVGAGAEGYDERALPPSQIALNFRLVARRAVVRTRDRRDRRRRNEHRYDAPQTERFRDQDHWIRPDLLVHGANDQEPRPVSQHPERRWQDASNLTRTCNSASPSLVPATS